MKQPRRGTSNMMMPCARALHMWLESPGAGVPSYAFDVTENEFKLMRAAFDVLKERSGG